MDLEFDDDQLALRESVRAVLHREAPTALARGMFDGSADGDALWKTMAGLGWPAITVPEEHGGLGRTAVEVALVAEELGSRLAPTPFFGTVGQFVPVVRELGSAEQHARWLRPVADGTATGTLAATTPTGTPTTTAPAVRARATASGYVLDGTASFVLDGRSASSIAVAAAVEGDDVAVFIVDGHDVRAIPLAIVDPTTEVAHVRFDGVTVDADRRLVGTHDVGRGLGRAHEEAAVAVALAIVGACSASVATNVEYAKAREQFEVPIGSFQAVKHMLADMYVAVERARALGYFAAAAIAEDDPRRSLAAAAAKASASDCQRLCVQHGIQLFGGIGFTWEHDMHLYARRLKVSDALCGDGTFHRAAVAELLDL